jgi:hypothetical protein
MKLLFFCHIQMKVSATSLYFRTLFNESFSSASHAIVWEDNCELNKKFWEELITYFSSTTN